MIYFLLLLNTILLAFDVDTLNFKNLLLQTQQIGIYSSLILDDSSICTFGGDGSINILRKQTVKKVSDFHRGAILSTIYNPTTKNIITAGWDGKIYSYDFQRDNKSTIYNNTNTILKIISLPNNNLIFTNNNKEIIQLQYINDTLFKLETNIQIQEYTTDELYYNHYTKEIYNIINSLFGCEMQIYDNNLELKKIIYFDNNFYSAYALNDTIMVFGDEYGNLSIFSTIDYQVKNSINISNNRIVKILQNNNILVISSWDNTVTLYDFEKEKIIKKLYIQKSWISDINKIENNLYIFTLDGSIYKTILM